jgi:hypothetical protein
MIKRFGSGYFAVTIDLGRPKYSKKKILEEFVSGCILSKLETEKPNAEWVCYTMKEKDKELAFIRGYHNGENNFHIQRIKSLLKDRISGHKYVPKILNAMEKDLKEQGVNEITSAVYLKLAPIAMRRYGFKHINGESAKNIKKSWLRFFPLSWKPLKKKI